MCDCDYKRLSCKHTICILYACISLAQVDQGLGRVNDSPPPPRVVLNHKSPGQIELTYENSDFALFFLYINI